MESTAIEQSGTIAEPETQVRPSSPNRCGSRWKNRLVSLAGLPWQRRLARAALYVEPVRHWEKEYRNISDEEMKRVAQQLRSRARSGESLDRLLAEVYGLVCVASERTLKLRPFDVQLVAGVILHQGALAELATGEGKTLVASLPTALNALTGKGVHVTTVNDYLARRDAEWMSPIYRSLGLSVGILQQQMTDQDRTNAYRSDITYGTASEFGFDFLRDRLKVSGAMGKATPFWAPWTNNGPQGPPMDPKVQREHNFGLVDEADNIFIDEARTPLIIANPTRPASEEESIVYLWADKLAQQMAQNQHFLMDEKKQKLELTEEGRQTIRWSNPPVGPHSHAMDKLQEHVERALHAHYRFKLDHDYMVDKKGKIVIVDVSTGRPQPDRHWREGLHQAVEAKEGVQITMASDHAAQITYQSYFRLYKKLAGMTGTAAQNWWEIRRVYKIWVVCVPTNRQVIRQHWPDRIFPTEDKKFDAVVEEVLNLRKQGRSVLIGTRSVDKSEKLSKRLNEAGVEHQVLNARYLDIEAQIVSRAGEPGKVTIATNMAGRGTDIKLAPSVTTAGGLHVLGTERHDARRIDRQLEGRSGRQGDPGSAQFFLSLEDELLEGLGPDWQEDLKETGIEGQDKDIDWQGYAGYFNKAQRRLEGRHFRQRVDLMVYEKNRREVLKDLGADPYVD